MQIFKNHSKYFIVAALTLSIVGGVFAQVSIPTGLTNAIQHIRETVWTSNGTNSGVPNVHIDDTNIYIRTGFLSNGTGWNNKALGVDSSGNVVYVDANGVAPIFALSPHVIPKLNSAGNSLEGSIVYQINNLIGINNINPTKTLDVMGDFKVQIPGGNQTMTYDLIGSNTGFSSGNPFSFPLPLGQFSCGCDTPASLGVQCSPQFTTTSLQGPGTTSFDYCFDYTVASSSPGLYNYDIYILSNVVGGLDIINTSGASISMGSGANASGTNSFAWSYGAGSGSSVFNNEFLVNTQKAIIGNIANADPFLFGVFYIPTRFFPEIHTYLPGRVGIDNALMLTGYAGFLGAGDLDVNNTGTISNLMVTSSFTAPSDVKLKTNIHDQSERGISGLAIINSLRPVTFQRDTQAYPNAGFDNTIRYGFIAQEILESPIASIARQIDSNFLYGQNDPFNQEENAGHEEQTQEPFYGVDPLQIIPILVQAIKEQQAMIEELQEAADANRSGWRGVQ